MTPQRYGDLWSAEVMTNALFARDSSIMRPGSFNRAENCADVAIPLIAAGGCRAVSVGVLARSFGVTPAATAKWFGTTEQMWQKVSEAIAYRWIVHTTASGRRRPAFAAYGVDVSDDDRLREDLRLFLPLDQDEIEWTRVWLSLLEHGRHHELTGAVMGNWEKQERELVNRLTMCRSVHALNETLVVVRGLRQLVAATHDPLALETAHAMLQDHVEHAYIANGVPEPTSDDDVLRSTQRMTYRRG